MPDWGDTALLDEIDFDDIHYFVKSSEQHEQIVGRRPRGHQAHVRPARHPRGRAQVLVRRLGAVRVRGRLPLRPRGSRKRRRPLLRHGHGAARAYPEIVKKYFATVIPPGDNKFAALNSRGLVGRLVRLRAAGRRSQDAAPSLLPDQHREHGPVRAHADHRRRRLEGALHRGLHRAAVLDRRRCTRRSSS